MLRYSRGLRTLAMAYAALAGAVDAIGFLKSGGLFVSFMTGNSTRLAVGLAQAASVAAAAGALIALFVAGTAFTVILSESTQRLHRKVISTLCIAVMLLAAAAMNSLGWNVATIAALCFAMGASNTVFRRDGEVAIGVTYMTGTLVKLGYRLADRVRGAGGASWLPYLLLWLSLVLGGVGGALLYLWSPEASLWSVAALSVALVGFTWSLVGRSPPGYAPPPNSL